jgi:hypothetical protein
MHAAKRRAYPRVCFNEGDAVVQVVAPEDEVIEHCRNAGTVRPEAMPGEHCTRGSDEGGSDEPSSTALHGNSTASWLALPLHPGTLHLMLAET